MIVLIVRHAAAAAREEWKLSDSWRPISDKGRRRFRGVVDALSDGDSLPDAILTSPLVRAVQTAEMLATTRGFRGEVEILSVLAPGHSAREAVVAVRARGEGCVAIVGHEPQVSAIAAEVLGAPLPIPFKKGMILAVEIGDDGAWGEVRFALLPGRKRAERLGRTLQEALAQ
jgi:phosphohistidine phosphatase